MTGGLRPWLGRLRPAGRNRRYAAVVVVTALLATVGLLWTADRLARTAAEALVTREIQRVAATSTPPEVTVQGGSFLLQALSGRYERVDVTLLDLSSGPLRVQRLDARLTGVRVPFGDLVRRNPDAMGVERATGRAFLSYDDLDAYLAFTGRPYSVGPGSRTGEVALAGTVQVLGRDYDVRVEARLGAEAGALTVAPTDLDTGTQLDRPAELLLTQRFTFVVPLDPLPFGQEVFDIDAGTDGVTVRTETDGLVLRAR